MYTVKEVAQRYHVNERRVLYAIKHGLLRATKFGWVWMIAVDDLPQEFPVRDYRKEIDKK